MTDNRTKQFADFYTELCEMEDELRKDSHWFGNQKKITDKKSRKEYEVVAFTDEVVSLEHQPHFESETKQNIKITYKELLDGFKAGNIVVEGFEQKEVFDLISVLKDTILHVRLDKSIGRLDVIEKKKRSRHAVKETVKEEGFKKRQRQRARLRAIESIKIGLQLADNK